MKKLFLFFIAIALISMSIYAPFDQILKELQSVQSGTDPKTLQQQKLAIMIKTIGCIKKCSDLPKDAQKDCMHKCLHEA